MKILNLYLVFGTIELSDEDKEELMKIRHIERDDIQDDQVMHEIIKTRREIRNKDASVSEDQTITEDTSQESSVKKIRIGVQDVLEDRTTGI